MMNFFLPKITTTSVVVNFTSFVLIYTQNRGKLITCHRCGEVHKSDGAAFELLSHVYHQLTRCPPHKQIQLKLECLWVGDTVTECTWRTGLQDEKLLYIHTM